MPKGDQRRGTCGHIVATWDTHLACLNCTKCTQESPCEICSSWTASVWNLAGKRRLYRDRKKKVSKQKVLSSSSGEEFEGFSDSEIVASVQKVTAVPSTLVTDALSSAGSAKGRKERLAKGFGVSTAEKRGSVDHFSYGKQHSLMPGVGANPSGEAIGLSQGNLADWPIPTQPSVVYESSDSFRGPKNDAYGRKFLETNVGITSNVLSIGQPGNAFEQNPYDSGKPVTGQPVTGHRNTGTPGTRTPGTGQPGSHIATGSPGFWQPGMSQPGTGQPGTGGQMSGQHVRGDNNYPSVNRQPDMLSDSHGMRDAGHPGFVLSGTGQPGTSQPGTGQPGNGGPGLGQHLRIDTGYHSFAGHPGMLFNSYGKPVSGQPYPGQLSNSYQTYGHYVPGSNSQPSNTGYREKSIHSPGGSVYISRDYTPAPYQPPVQPEQRGGDLRVTQAYREQQYPNNGNLQPPGGHLSMRQSLDRHPPEQVHSMCPVKGRPGPSHTVSSVPTVDPFQLHPAAEGKSLSKGLHQYIDSSHDSLSESVVQFQVERPSRAEHGHRIQSSPTPSSDEEMGDQSFSGDEPTVERMSLQQAIDEVFRVVPDHFCPKVDAPPRRKNLSSLEELNAEAFTPLRLLPQANNLGRLIEQLQATRSLDSCQPWSVPAAISKEWVTPKKYTTSKEFFPVKVPALDGDAAMLGLSAPTSVTVNSKLLEKWEARARLGVMVSSHDDHFAIALSQLLKEENVSSRGANRILEAFDTGNRHLMALNLQNATEMLSARRDAALAKSSLLLQESKDKLRAAPLASDLLFGGRIAAVTVSDSAEQSRRLSANAANAFAQSQKRSAPSGKGGKARKPPLAKKQKQDVKAFAPKQPSSTGQKSAKPKPHFQAGAKRHTSKRSSLPRPQP